MNLEAAARVTGLRLAADAGEWMHAVRAEPIGRSDFQAKVEAVALAMASAAHQQAATVRRRHTLLAESATVHARRPITTRDVGKAVKRLAENGLLVVLVAGRVPRAGEAHGTVPLYALTVPEKVDMALPDRVPGGRGRCMQRRRAHRANSVRRALGLPVVESENLRRPAETCAHGEAGEAALRLTAGRRSPGEFPENSGRPGGAVDRSGNRNRGFSRRGGSSPLPPGEVRPPRPRRGDISPASTRRYHARLLATRLGADSATLRKIAPARLAKIVTPFAAAGWSPPDVLHALDHRPDGTAHLNTDAVRCPPGWVRWRLGHWYDDGAVVASRSQRSIPGWRWPAYETGDISVPARPWETRAYDESQPGPRFTDPKGEVRRIVREGAQHRRAEAQQQMARGVNNVKTLVAWCPHLAALDRAFAAHRLADAEQHDREMQSLEQASPILRARRDNAGRDTVRLAALARTRREAAYKGTQAVDSSRVSTA